MMSACASMALSLSGDTALRSLTTCPCLLLLMARWDALSSWSCDCGPKENKCSKFSHMQMFWVVAALISGWLTSILSIICPSDLLCPRWPVSIHPDTGPDQNHWQKTGSAPWWAHVWPPLVGPWRYTGVSQAFQQAVLYSCDYSCTREPVLYTRIIWS